MKIMISRFICMELAQGAMWAGIIIEFMKEPPVDSPGWEPTVSKTARFFTI